MTKRDELSKAQDSLHFNKGEVRYNNLLYNKGEIGWSEFIVKSKELENERTRLIAKIEELKGVIKR